MDSHKEQQLPWNIVIEALSRMYATPTKFLLQSQLSFVGNVDPHSSCVFKGYRLTSLYHDRFGTFYNAHDLVEELECIDKEVPKLYNMGRSLSAQFAFTKSQRYLIKVINASNFYYFKRVFHQQYFKLMTQDKTLLAKTYGVFSLEKDATQFKVHFILMENLFHQHYTQNCRILNVFDLKGATQNRITKGFENEWKIQQVGLSEGRHDLPLVKGKDQDFLKIDLFNHLSPEVLQFIYQRIDVETQLLCEARVMDYSLMIVISYGEDIKECGRMIRMNEHIGVTVGIIDYFQEYNSSKKLETKLKQLLGQNSMSCVDSDSYRQRFKEYFARLHHQ